jgi:GntR family transcriptional regulator
VPKYAEIVNALQTRIDGQTYRIGDLLPSEAQLTQEFATSRSTVVRALRFLRQHGWVEGVQGKGRIIRGRPATRLSTAPPRIQALLQPGRHATPLGARHMPATARVASALACPVGTLLPARRYLLGSPDAVPFGLVTVLTHPTLTADIPATAGFLVELERANNVAAHRVVERLGARLATEAEATALALARRRSLAVVLLTVLDAADRPLFAVDAVLSRDIPQLASSYLLI